MFSHLHMRLLMNSSNNNILIPLCLLGTMMPLVFSVFSNLHFIQDVLNLANLQGPVPFSSLSPLFYLSKGFTGSSQYGNKAPHLYQVCVFGGGSGGWLHSAWYASSQATLAADQQMM